MTEDLDLRITHRRDRRRRSLQPNARIAAIC
jgi:hypothetical protein